MYCGARTRAELRAPPGQTQIGAWIFMKCLTLHSYISVRLTGLNRVTPELLEFRKLRKKSTRYLTVCGLCCIDKLYETRTDPVKVFVSFRTYCAPCLDKKARNADFHRYSCSQWHSPSVSLQFRITPSCSSLLQPCHTSCYTQSGFLLARQLKI